MWIDCGRPHGWPQSAVFAQTLGASSHRVTATRCVSRVADRDPRHGLGAAGVAVRVVRDGTRVTRSRPRRRAGDDPREEPDVVHTPEAMVSNGPAHDFADSGETIQTLMNFTDSGEVI